MLVYRSTVAAAMFAGVLLVGCSDPDLPTDLRKDGPPDVTTVTVMSDPISGIDPGLNTISRLIETATYCRLGDNKRPGLVGLPSITTTQVCPDDLTQPSLTDGTAEGTPPSWFVRVVFDMLLDPNIEDLINNGTAGSLANTQPVTLQCGPVDGVPLVDVPYDGYYVPNGNRISWPLGPALFIKALDPTSVATGAHCEISIKDIVKNKAGQSVPADQRGPYKFSIAKMVLRLTVPDFTADPAANDQVDPGDPVLLYFTAGLKVPADCDPAKATNQTCTTSIKPTTDLFIYATPNLDDGTTSGALNPAVCAITAGQATLPPGITQVDPQITHASIMPAPSSGASPTTTSQLVMALDAEGQDDTKPFWAPRTSYVIRFGPDARVSPAQGGPDATFPVTMPPSPDDFKICFSTTVAQ